MDYSLEHHPFAGEMLSPMLPPASGREYETSDVQTPIGYRGVSMFIASLPVERAALQSALPNGLRARRLFGPYGCLNLQFVSMPDTDVGPYSECVVSIACDDEFSWNNQADSIDWRPLPCFPLWLSVDTVVARDAGHRFWAYPKVVAETALESAVARSKGTVRIGGDVDLELAIPYPASHEAGDLEIRSLTVANGELWQTAFSGKASINREQDVPVSLKLGGFSAISRWLGSLSIPDRALEVVSVKDFNYELDAPFNVVPVLA